MIARPESCIARTGYEIETSAACLRVVVQRIGRKLMASQDLKTIVSARVIYVLTYHGCVVEYARTRLVTKTGETKASSFLRLSTEVKGKAQGVLQSGTAACTPTFCCRCNHAVIPSGRASFRASHSDGRIASAVVVVD